MLKSYAKGEETRRNRRTLIQQLEEASTPAQQAGKLPGRELHIPLPGRSYPSFCLPQRPSTVSGTQRTRERLLTTQGLLSKMTNTKAKLWKLPEMKY